MKLNASLVIVMLAILQPSNAAMSVIDITQIRTNLMAAQRQLAQTIIHGKNQIEQIRQLAQQIQQAETYLDRLGDPSAVSVETLNEALAFLNSLELNLSSEEIVEGLDPDEIFTDRSDGPYGGVPRDIRVAGEVIGRRNAQPFAPEVAARRGISHYRQVRAATLERRKLIKQELEATLHQLDRASNAAEIQKLDIVSRNLEAQLSAADQEIEFAASEVATRFFESQVENDVQAKAERQAKQAAFKTAINNSAEFYRLPTRPVLFKR